MSSLLPTGLNQNLMSEFRNCKNEEDIFDVAMKSPINFWGFVNSAFLDRQWLHADLKDRLAFSQGMSLLQLMEEVHAGVPIKLAEEQKKTERAWKTKSCPIG